MIKVLTSSGVSLVHTETEFKKIVTDMMDYLMIEEGKDIYNISVFMLAQYITGCHLNPVICEDGKLIIDEVYSIYKNKHY